MGPPFHLDEGDKATVEKHDKEEGDERRDCGPDAVAIVQLGVVILIVISEATKTEVHDAAVPRVWIMSEKQRKELIQWSSFNAP